MTLEEFSELLQSVVRDEIALRKHLYPNKTVDQKEVDETVKKLSDLIAKSKKK